MYQLIISLCVLLTLCLVSGKLTESLSYYEVIDHISVFSRYKRSVDDGDEKLMQEFSLRAFNRTLTCEVHPRTEIFSPGFKVTVVHQDGSKDDEAFQEGNIFEGKVLGVEDSAVHGHFEDDMFTGTVDVGDEFFVVEPLWRHIDEPDVNGSAQTDGRMIVYRGSDIIRDLTHGNMGTSKTFCGAVHLKDDSSSNQHADTPGTGFPSRTKRSTPSWNTCPLIVVADYKFYQSMGGSSVYRTASYMAGVIERVDAIFKSTVWNTGGLTGLGFEIESMVIHDSPTSVSDGGKHYNMVKSDWDVLDLLKVFSHDLTFQNYCLAHLFTYQSFANNVLGLAYIASEKTSTAGGICSIIHEVDGQKSSPNTALSTARNSLGNTVLAQMADLVTAHEFGHNWGSEHDGGDCSPSSILGDGKYLMYPYSVSGTNDNNYKFSSCSKVQVNKVLQVKGADCFKERTVQQSCGNGVLDADVGEECDAGYLGKFGLDPCCSSSCKLTAGSQCSPVNHECCVGCQMANIGHVCVSENIVSCSGASYCLLDCPPAPKKDDDTECLDGGLCKDGVCVSFCEARGMVSCVCIEVEKSCFRCCQANSSSVCEPYDSSSRLPDGRPCVQGYCEQGSCKKTVQDTIERFFSIIDSLTKDGIAAFFKDNLIGVVMILSLLVWIPVCIAVTVWDRHRRKSFEEDMYRAINRDRKLIFDQDGRKEKRPMSMDEPTLRELNAMDLRRSLETPYFHN